MAQTIQGLKTQESSDFIRFFEIVQKHASRTGKVFFLECEDGHDSVVNGMEVCDLQGWLVPEDMVDEFEPIWEEDGIDDDWDDFFCFAKWIMKRNIEVVFEK